MYKMSKSAKVILFLFLLLLVGLLLSEIWWNRYDRFHPYQLTLSSPKRSYVIGDTIELIYEIRSRSRGSIRLYKDRQKSLSIFLREACGSKPDLSDSDFYSYHKAPSADDEIEVIEIGPNKSFYLQVKGQIVASKDWRKIIFNFPEFGSFVKKYKENYMIGGFWLPINPAPEDSLEDHTNTILIKVAAPQNEMTKKRHNHLVCQS